MKRSRDLFGLLESENKVCDVNQKCNWINMVIIIVQQTVLFLSEKFFHYCKIQYSNWGINREKKTLCFLHLTDCEETDNKVLHQRSGGIKIWSIKVGHGSEAKSVNNILSRKAIALSEAFVELKEEKKLINTLKRIMSSIYEYFNIFVIF